MSVRAVLVVSFLGLAAAATAATIPRCTDDRDGRGASRPSGTAVTAHPKGAETAASPVPVPSASSATLTAARAIPKIDLHTHVDPEIFGEARGFLRARGIEHAINLSGGMPGDGLEETVAAAHAAGDFFTTFVNVNFQGIGEPGWAAREVAQLERAKKLGVKGVKIPKSLGLKVRFTDGRRVPVDDPALDPLFDAMARLGLPLAIHTGDPKAFFDPPSHDNERYDELASHPAWSFADRRLYPTWEALYGEFERRVTRSAKTTIIGVHFGNAPEEPERVLRMLERHPNLYVDTAARVPELGRRPEAVRRVIEAFPDRVLFGTDVQLGPGMLVLGAGEPRGHTRADVDRFFLSTWRFFETSDRGFEHPTPIQGRWSIDGIALAPAILEKIYHANAERLLGIHL